MCSSLSGTTLGFEKFQGFVEARLARDASTLGDWKGKRRSKKLIVRARAAEITSMEKHVRESTDGVMHNDLVSRSGCVILKTFVFMILL